MAFQRIAVLGFAFKADTGDTRESAAITLIRNFLSERAKVSVYDPKVSRYVILIGASILLTIILTQVTEAQIWLDLQEAIPATPLADST